MANTVKLKRSSVASKVPLATDLVAGELAMNTADGKLFMKKDSGTIIEIGPAQTISDDTSTNATYYPSFTTTSSGTATFKASSSKLTFNPSSGTLTTTSLYATTKSFVINHPTKEGMKLRYGSLEGPENGVYVRGKLNNGGTIELPEYWTNLIDEDSITVNLTPIGKHQNLYVKSILNNTVVIGGSRDINCFYTIFAERKDVEKLTVEIE